MEMATFFAAVQWERDVGGFCAEETFNPFNACKRFREVTFKIAQVYRRVKFSLCFENSDFRFYSTGWFHFKTYTQHY